MKSVMLFLLLAVFLSLPASVSADQTNWFFYVKATDLNGLNRNVDNQIGCWTGWSDFIERTKGEPGEVSRVVPPGVTIATTAIEFYTGEIGTRDIREPLIDNWHPKTWTIKIFQLSDNGPDLGPVKLVLTPYHIRDAMGDFRYPYHFRGSFIPGGGCSFYWGDKVPETITWVINNVPINPTDMSSVPTLTIQAGDYPIPEPSSLAAIACGICGLGVSTFRKRR